MLWDTKLTIFSVDHWLRLPSNEHNDNIDGPQLALYLWSVLFPFTVLKSFLCGSVLKSTTVQIKAWYFRILVGQMLMNNIFFLMQLFYYKSFLINIATSYKDEIFTEITFMMAQGYVFLLNLWSVLEFLSHVIFWWKGYNIGFYSVEE